MKTRKTIPEISGTTVNADRLDQTKLYLFKIFSLPIWLVIISIILSFVAAPVRAGIEDIHPYYRYVPYEGPASAAGKQVPKQPPGASETEAKKGEQAASTGEKTESAKPAAKESAGQAPAPGGQAAAPGQTAQQLPSAKEPETECPFEQKSSTESKIPPVKRPEKDTGEFPSGGIPSFCKADVNGDHYVTKDELQNFPDLLRVFDKVDAGKDGRLEQHEYINLEMETSREGEVM
ncbi:EF-hand domain-containing protein [Methylobacter sp.]|uniref:EF-hand domain-containing protein n=1 Tax=Methylobacter sp. TaxID=2051955 RepID=UPI0025E14718|nr:EF-hand domain-containing protein [Methylobacter sp.]